MFIYGSFNRARWQLCECYTVWILYRIYLYRYIIVQVYHTGYLYSYRVGVSLSVSLLYIVQNCYNAANAAFVFCRFLLCYSRCIIGIWWQIVNEASARKANSQWRCYTRARQVKWPGWKIHRPGSSPGSDLRTTAYSFASVIVWTEN